MRLVTAAFGLTLAALACGGSGDGGTTPSPYVLVANGRAERGLTVHVGARKTTDTTSLAAVTGLSASPADAATITATGDVTFTKAGVVTLTAIAQDGTALTLAVTVATPPGIVFDGRANGNRDIYRVALDGGQLTRLTTNVADDLRPSTSGDAAVYTSFRDGNAELYSVSFGTGVERRLTQTDDGESQPSLAPDGKHVAYTNNASGVSKVWVSDLNLAAANAISASRRLTPATFGSGAAPESSPSWAPTSDKVVFVATATPSGSAGLFTIATSAAAVPALIGGSGTQVEVEPSLSADGFRVAYASVISGATEIFVRDPRTGAATQVTKNTGSSGQPTWLSDGRIVFTIFSGANASLRWVDPAIPFELHDIPIAALSAEHAAPVR